MYLCKLKILKKRFDIQHSNVQQVVPTNLFVVFVLMLMTIVVYLSLIVCRNICFLNTESFCTWHIGNIFALQHINLRCSTYLGQSAQGCFCCCFFLILVHIMFEPVLFSIKLHNKKPLWTLVQVIPLYFGSKQEILTPMVSHLCNCYSTIMQVVFLRILSHQPWKLIKRLIFKRDLEKA